MEAITIRLEASTLESLDCEAAGHGRTRSEHIRESLQARNEHERIRAEYEGEIADLGAENGRLERKLAAVNGRYKQHTELVEYVEEERELQRAREQRRNVPAWTRAKWWLFGRSESEK